MDKIQPRPTLTSEPYWQGCREGVLRLQRCDACSVTQFYPRIVCASCQATSLSWIDASGHGTIASYSVVRRGVSEAYPAPYIVALIDLAEGPRMMSHIINADPEDVQVGGSVQVTFQTWSDEIEMPVFELTDQASLK